MYAGSLLRACRPYHPHYALASPPWETSVQAAVGTLSLEGSSASFSGNVTYAQDQTSRPALGPLRLEYKSGPNAWATGIFLQDTTGRVGINTETPSQQLDVNGTAKATAFSGNGSALTGTNLVPAGAVSFFNLASCPTGWSALDGTGGRPDGRGFTLVGLPASGTLAGSVGSALTNLGNRTISSVPSHTHAVDPPSTASSSDNSHTHTADPALTATSTDGAHTHTVSTYSNALNSNTVVRGGSGSAVATQTVDSASGHQHTVDVASFTSGGTSNAHTHTVDIASFSSGSTGSATVDVTMPYIQYLLCQKD